jgi:hypothetical protein
MPLLSNLFLAMRNPTSRCRRREHRDPYHLQSFSPASDLERCKDYDRLQRASK